MNIFIKEIILIKDNAIINLIIGLGVLLIFIILNRKIKR